MLRIPVMFLALIFGGFSAQVLAEGRASAPLQLAKLMAPAPHAAPYSRPASCTKGELDECADTLNKCKEDANGDRAAIGACSKEMGSCIEGCGLIPRGCRWENVDTIRGRFICI